jgi:hypothetical protein
MVSAFGPRHRVRSFESYRPSSRCSVDFENVAIKQYRRSDAMFYCLCHHGLVKWGPAIRLVRAPASYLRIKPVPPPCQTIVLLKVPFSRQL